MEKQEMFFEKRTAILTPRPLSRRMEAWKCKKWVEIAQGYSIQNITVPEVGHKTLLVAKLR